MGFLTIITLLFLCTFAVIHNGVEASDSPADFNERPFFSGIPFTPTPELCPVPTHYNRISDVAHHIRELQLASGALQTFTQNLLDDASSTVSSVSEDIARFKQTITNILSSADQLHADMRDAAHARGTNLTVISDMLDGMFMDILEEIKVTFPPPDQAPTHEDRRAMAHAILQMAEDALVHLGVGLGLQEEILRRDFNVIKPHIEELVVTIGDLIEQHPILADILIRAVAGLILPEFWLLTPLLGLFGFGPDGPIKGSAATWAQSLFFGGIVPKGSWFSHLQRAGMKIIQP